MGAAVDPEYAEARAALEHLRIHQVLASARSIVAPEYRPAPRKLGDYLIEQGLVTAAQVEEALAELRSVQAKTQRGAIEESKIKHLGDILLQRGWLTPSQLANALVRQQQERSRGGQRPERVGEYLMAQNLVTGDQLGTALAEQARLRWIVTRAYWRAARSRRRARTSGAQPCAVPAAAGFCQPLREYLMHAHSRCVASLGNVARMWGAPPRPEGIRIPAKGSYRSATWLGCGARRPHAPGQGLATPWIPAKVLTTR